MPISFFEEPTRETLLLPDDQFVRQITWSQAVSSEIRQAATTGDIPGLAAALQASLSETSRNKRRIDLQSLWSKTAFVQSDRSRALAALTGNDSPLNRASGDRKSKTGKKNKPSANGSDSNSEKHVTRWLDGVERGARLSDFEQLVLGDLLVSRKFSRRVFFKLWRILLTASIELSCRLQDGVSQEPDEHRLIVFAGELPWRAGHLFQTVAKSKRLRERGCQVLHELLTESTDTDGAPESTLLESLPFWIAALVRSTIWAKVFRVELWDDATAERLTETVRRTVTLCRPDGQLSFADLPTTECVAILNAAARYTGYKKKSSVRAFVSGLGDANFKSSKTGYGQPTGSRKPGFQSDWAEVACLRNWIGVDSDQVALRHDQEVPVLDVSILGVPLMHGPWRLSITVDGQPVGLSADWTCTCWHSDKDADYIELQLQLDEIAVDRQILLSRKRHFLIFSDVLSGAGKTPVTLESEIALHDDIQGDHDVTTREVRIHGNDLKARVFPLGLDQDRIMSTPGSCSVEDGRLYVTQQGEGGLYAPVMIDWHPDRQSDPCDWTRLTVTESRAIVTPNIAAGFRIRTGLQQLLIYRSLQETEIPRAVLGHHTANETVVARFSNGGQVNPIVLVE